MRGKHEKMSATQGMEDEVKKRVKGWRDGSLFWQRTQVQISAPMLGSSQLPWTPAPRASNASGFYGPCIHMCIPSHRHIHIQIILKIIMQVDYFLKDFYYKWKFSLTYAILRKLSVKGVKLCVCVFKQLFTYVCICYICSIYTACLIYIWFYDIYIKSGLKLKIIKSNNSLTM